MLPSTCALCNESGANLLCANCHYQFLRQESARCPQCAIPLISDARPHICGECLSQPPYFEQTIVATDYAAPFDQLVLALKFGHRLPLAKLFSELMRDAILRQAEQYLPQILCPVPLGSQRLRERGFNQSLEIAKPLATQLGIPMHAELLRRTRDTVQQSGLHPDARQKNIRNAFAVNETAIDLIQGKHIGVIDDVMTTGTTLNEIAALLKRFGATKISNYVFARTTRH